MNFRSFDALARGGIGVVYPDPARQAPAVVLAATATDALQVVGQVRIGLSGSSQGRSADAAKVDFFLLELLDGPSGGVFHSRESVVWWLWKGVFAGGAAEG